MHRIAHPRQLPHQLTEKICPHVRLNLATATSRSRRCRNLNASHLISHPGRRTAPNRSSMVLGTLGAPASRARTARCLATSSCPRRAGAATSPTRSPPAVASSPRSTSSGEYTASCLRYVATGIDAGLSRRTSSASAAYPRSGGTVQFARVGGTSTNNGTRRRRCSGGEDVGRPIIVEVEVRQPRDGLEVSRPHTATIVGAVDATGLLRGP